MERCWSFALLPEMMNEYLTTVEAAKVLKIGKSTLEQMRLKGDGPRFVKFGPKNHPLSFWRPRGMGGGSIPHL
jgi:hypothetical protein